MFEFLCSSQTKFCKNQFSILQVTVSFVAKPSSLTLCTSSPYVYLSGGVAVVNSQRWLTFLHRRSYRVLQGCAKCEEAARICFHSLPSSLSFPSSPTSSVSLISSRCRGNKQYMSIIPIPGHRGRTLCLQKVECNRPIKNNGFVFM